MTQCRVCCKPISAFMSFGPMPIANGFLTPDRFGDEMFFELAPAFCEACGTFQIIEQPTPDAMFHESYAFFTRTSKRMVAHFADYAAWVRKTHLRDELDPFVVEIGSNDGAMLEFFAKAGTRHLGIEPSANVAEEARRHGVQSLVAFFSGATGRAVRAEHGPASAVLAANVMCHIPDLHSVAEGVDALLAPDGVFVFEDPYLGAMVEKTSYDQIYDEHVFIFSLKSVRAAFAPHGFEVIDVMDMDTHGGSMRYVLAREGVRPVSDSVELLARREQALGLDRIETFKRFRMNCERSRENLVALLVRLRKEGRRVTGYGATSKSTTILNYCKIGPDLIEFISDTTPIKQHKFSPGMHIPIQPYEAFKVSYPDYAVLFAWNHRHEIMGNEQGFSAAGGKWIHFVPDVSVSG